MKSRVADMEQYSARFFKLKWKVVLSSFAKGSRYKERAKQKGAEMYVMKPWSWSEICAVAPLQAFALRATDDLWDAYCRSGASPRIVYDVGDLVQHEGAIRDTLVGCQNLNLLCPRDWNDSVSNVLVAIGPATVDGVIRRNILSEEIATPYIIFMRGPSLKILSIASRAHICALRTLLCDSDPSYAIWKAGQRALTRTGLLCYQLGLYIYSRSSSRCHSAHLEDLPARLGAHHSQPAIE
ncbi:hypothetical protein BKA93DRAFT_471699 [Sparassis latifolia]